MSSTEVTAQTGVEIDIQLSGRFVPGCAAYGGSRFEPPINPPEPDEIEDVSIDALSVSVPTNLTLDGVNKYRVHDLLEGVDLKSPAVQRLLDNILNALGDEPEEALMREAMENA